MSRGVKDLRELICISRLTCRDSESDGRAASGDDDDDSADSLETWSVGGRSSAAPSPSPAPHARGGAAAGEPDQSRYRGSSSGNVRQMSSASSSGDAAADHPLLPTTENGTPASKKKNKKKRKKKKKRAHHEQPLGVADGWRGSDTWLPADAGPSAATVVELTKLRVLPALRSASRSPSSTDDGASSEVAAMHQDAAIGREELERLLAGIDPAVVSDWLERANRMLDDLSDWCSSSKRYVAFVHFWLSEFSAAKRQEILKLEHDIALEEMCEALAPGLNSGAVRKPDVSRLLAAVYREYPRRLCSAAGAYLFLDYLDTFTSERASEYRHILTDVKLSTANREHAHYLLAARCFVLIAAWYAVIDFYRKLHAEVENDGSRAPSALPPPDRALLRSSSDSARDYERNMERVQEAVQRGYADVCQYYFRSGKVSASAVDRHGRTFFFVAVTSRQTRCADYLLKKWPGCTDVNRPCDSGNSPIHVAVNLGDEALVRQLLLISDIDVNAKNPYCDDATALHLAAMHGHVGIAKLLLASGKVDHSCRMGGLTALEFAKDLGHVDFVKALEDYASAVQQKKAVPNV